jgi:hypothetical protein
VQQLQTSRLLVSLHQPMAASTFAGCAMVIAEVRCICAYRHCMACTLKQRTSACMQLLCFDGMRLYITNPCDCALLTPAGLLLSWCAASVRSCASKQEHHACARPAQVSAMPASALLAACAGRSSAAAAAVAMPHAKTVGSSCSCSTAPAGLWAWAPWWGPLVL